jgi:hypothetical protein
MPTRKKTTTTRQSATDIERLKAEYIEYFKDVPVQRYAAMAIGRNEDTILVWKRNDAAFSEAVEKARAEWVRKKAMEVKAEFALERLEKDIWSQRTELTGKDGGPIELKPVEVMQVSDGNQPEASKDS